METQRTNADNTDTEKETKDRITIFKINQGKSQQTGESATNLTKKIKDNTQAQERQEYIGNTIKLKP